MHEKKSCSRCHKLFDCKPGNITQCHCYGVPLSQELKAFLEQRYDDCLCHDCLQHVKEEWEVFKERFIFR